MEKREDMNKDRAWIEINRNHLENNIKEIKKIISDKTKIMAVVKANAYGHGIIPISKELNKLGIEDFAVATLEEGIILRQNHIKGNILILGYTHFDDIPYVIKYDLIQTIVDYEYAKRLEELKLDRKIKVHIKINTGMNRIGESYKHIDKLLEIYKMKSLDILGTFTHLSVSDSHKVEDIEFTKNQIKSFDDCVQILKENNCNVGKLHVQASYGVVNYPELTYDYVRIGIMMYGNLSSRKDITKLKPNIKAVLSLKARITSIKEINKDEAVGYGRGFIATNNIKIASVAIGYADGYPRNLSNHAKVIINGQAVPVIGRICMDQLMIDISTLTNVKVGDVVTLIGEDSEILAESIADQTGTISNEILSRLGNRLNIILE